MQSKKYTIVSESAFQLVNADLYIFGVLQSKMHTIWVKSVAGRLKSDIRYSNTLVYNAFVFPKVTQKQKNHIKDLSRNLLKTRHYLLDKGNSIADLYDKLFMLIELQNAHKKLDKAIEDIYKNHPKKIDAFLEHLFYKQQDVNTKESYQDLLQMSLELDDKFDLKGNRLFYLAMSPNFFGIVTNYLKETGLTNVQGFKRIIIEKPFGDDLKSAEKLNNQIRKSFKEQEIFRIDHYLGKEMIQNIERLRFGNTIFEPLWNNKYISNIQVTSSETLGIEDRGSYYESSGALKDMVQNHLLQMVSLLAMEPPISRKSSDIRKEKVQVLKTLKCFNPNEIKKISYVVNMMGE